MNECKWCNQKYEKSNMDNGFCSAQCEYGWEKKAESMGLRKRPADLPKPIGEEEKMKRYAQAMVELINFVRLMAKRHTLNPMEVIGVYKLVDETLLSGGTNIELAVILRDMQKSGFLPTKTGQTDEKDLKTSGYS